VVPAINRFTENGAEFIDGHREDFDAVIFATGYKSNVPSWLKVHTYLHHLMSLHNLGKDMNDLLIQWYKVILWQLVWEDVSRVMPILF
jgi:hypothetical protein